MIDLGEQIYVWRQKLDKMGQANKEKKLMINAMTPILNSPFLFNSGLRMAPIVNHLPRPLKYNGLNAWGKHRELPKFAKQSFNNWWKENQKK